MSIPVRFSVELGKYSDMIEFITNKQAEAMLGVNRETLQKYVQSGKLRKFKTPTGRNRYDLSEVGSLIREVVTK